jgi:ABC-type amino acid transport substrate-binding protein
MDSPSQNNPNIVQKSEVENNDSSTSSNPPSHKKGLSLPLVSLLLFFALVIGGLAVWLYMNTQTTQKESVVNVTPSAPAKAKKLVVGTDATLPPMEFVEDGTYLGYDIDLTNALAQELNTEIEFKQIVFDDLFTALENKEIDMIISAVTITDERKLKYDFSEPYLNAGQVIITKKDNMTIKTTSDLKGKRIAVQAGTTNETQALLYTSPELVMRYPDYVQATKALVDGKVDALFNDLPGGKGNTNENPTLKIASDPFTNEYYGIVFRKGDPDAKTINEALASIRVKGILTDLKQKWLD